VAAAGGLGLLPVLIAVVGLVVKYRRSGKVRRQQIKWLAYAAGIVAVSNLGIPPLYSSLIPATLQTGPWATVIFALSIGTIVLLPIAMAIAILRYRLYDIDLVINRTVTYGALAAAITLIYIAIVIGVGGVIGRGGRANFLLSLAATALVAVAFQPIRQRAQHIANRLVYGDRATPYEVLSRFSQRIAESVASDEALREMAEVLAHGTGASRAEVWLRIGASLQCAARYPDTATRPDPVPLDGESLPEILGVDALVPVRYQGELLGALAVGKQGANP